MAQGIYYSLRCTIPLPAEWVSLGAQRATRGVFSILFIRLIMKKGFITTAVALPLAVCLGMGYLHYRDMSHRLDLAEHNAQARLDSLRLLRDAQGRLYAERRAFVSTIEGLRSLSGALHDRVAELERSVSRRLVAGANVAVVVHDTVQIRERVPYEPDSVVRLPISMPGLEAMSLVRVGAETISLESHSYRIEVPLEVYLTRDYRVIARSPSEHVSFVDLQAFVDPSLVRNSRRRPWGLGVQLGVGLAPGGVATPSGGRPALMPYVGVGLSYNLLTW